MPADWCLNTCMYQTNASFPMSMPHVRFEEICFLCAGEDVRSWELRLGLYLGFGLRLGWMNNEFV
jgi:hypothetical protein